MADDQSPQGEQPLATFQSDGLTGVNLTVHTTVARIGQGPQNDIVIDDDTVSTNHARLEYMDGAWRLTDLGSRNGTYVEGVRLAPEVTTPLAENTIVAFGAVSMTFHGRMEVEPELLSSAAAREEGTTQVRRAGFRLPVWLVVLIIVLAAVLVFTFLSLGGGDVPPTQPANVESTAHLIIQSTYRFGFV